MKRKEIDIAVDWARKEGWNPGIYDAECFWAQDPKGFFIGLLDDKPIAVMSLVKYGTNYAFGGFYIVKSGYRGKGYGKKLFDYALRSVEGRNIGGDGVIENLDKYDKEGLKLYHYNARYEFKAKNEGHSFENLFEIQKVSLNDLVNYDQRVFGYNRRDFLQLWISRPMTKGFVHIENNDINGYGIVRKCFKGYKIGPIFAENNEIANEIFISLVGSVRKGTNIYWDVNEECKLIKTLSEDYRMRKVFRTGRIYSKGQPNFQTNKWFGITSFELG